MLYSCKQCGTKFNIRDETLRPGGTRFRCTKCGTPFVLRGPAATQMARPAMLACPRCRGLNDSNATACSHCGLALAPGPPSAYPQGMPPVRVKILKKINPHLFSVPLWGSVIARLAVKHIMGAHNPIGGLIEFAASLAWTFAIIYGFIALYRCWSAIEGHGARTTPGKAVGFLFIPLFNLYWLFVAIRGLAVDANAFLGRKGIMGKGISEKLSLAFCILSLVAFPIASKFSPVAALLVAVAIQTVLVYQWAAFNNGVIGTPGHAERRVPAGAKMEPAVMIIAIIVSVMVGIAVLGILAAIAIPAFLGQREKARMRALESNYTMAISTVTQELRKCASAPGSVTTDVVAKLNAIENINPWFPEADAFSASFGKGQVAISTPNLQAVCGTDSTVVIMADNKGDGVEDEEYVKVIGPSGDEVPSPRLRPAPERRPLRPGETGI